ncbi:hypothetical protein P5673_011127 [Acropora cervicornis]|uniref:O-acyltransferase WSD1 C-terminal domain-containing protein n=1 Tax=Acropora cervicornis TaxID=6130 RepID=A0AAD9QPP6_ACRCE|nr:hypothetical protein P5673_011127 [Acropora cervicornis]
MCSTQDGCWAYPPRNHCLNRTSPIDRLATNNARLMSKRLSHPADRSNFLVRIVVFFAIWITHTLFFVLFVAVVILVVPLCYCLRGIMFYYSLRRNHRSEKLTKMPGSEAVWLRSCVNDEMPIPITNIFFIFDGQITMDEVHNFVRVNLLPQGKLSKSKTRLLKLKHFPVRVMTGYGWKELDDFNINNHVSERIDNALIPMELKETAQMLDGESLEIMWRVLLFPNFRESEHTGILIQVHESIADVFPSTRVVLESLGYKTVFLKKQCFLLGRVATLLSACFTGPLVIIKRLLMRKTDQFFTTDLESKDSSLHATWSRAVDLKSIKRIKDVTRTKVDIILLSCVAGAIRAYLQKSKAINPDDIRVCIRTDLRPQHTKLNLDNQFSLAFINLPVGTEAMRRLINFLINKVPCTVTQIPGPNTPVYLNGKMAKMMACWTPRKTENGLSICLTHHGGQVHLGLVSHHSQINNCSLLIAEFEREVADLVSHLGKRALPSHLRWRYKLTNQQSNEVFEDREAMEEADV